MKAAPDKSQFFPTRVKFVPVGHVWRFDLEQYEQRDFGVKFTSINFLNR